MSLPDSAAAAAAGAGAGARVGPGAGVSVGARAASGARASASASGVAIWRGRCALGLMLASGFAGLGYQVVWTQQSALWLGHEAAAVLAVITAFFGGMALGAWALGPRIERSASPVRWYAGCEAVIAGWSVLLAFAMSPWSSVLLRVMGPTPGALWQWLVAFVGTFLLLLPATAAMGATLPAMERLALPGARAALYASNTLGAFVGVLAIAFWLIPAVGLMRTTVVCAVLNGVCALVSLRVFVKGATVAERSLQGAGLTQGAGLGLGLGAGAMQGAVLTLNAGATSSAGPTLGARPMPVAGKTPGWRGSVVALAVTGFLGIGYEVAVVRVLSQVAEDTVYTFALLLAVYLLGSAAGAAMYRRWQWSADKLLTTASVACLAGTGTLWAAEALKGWVLEWLGPAMGSALTAEGVLAFAAFALPTVAMGALFSCLATREGVSFGRALGANTAGAAFAPVVLGVVALPAIGSKLTLLLIAMGYLLLLARRTRVTLLPMSVAAALAAFAAPLIFVDGNAVSYQEGVMAAVSVVEDDDGVRRLRINNRQQEGSSVTLRVDARQAWLPLLLHPAPRRALFLGLGTGVTATSATEDPSLTVDAVELLPEVISASKLFTEGAQLHVMAADARRYVRTSDQRYDVIVSDNFHPARSGSGSLYTVEHFEAVRDRLAPGGVFCQWLPLHQLDLAALRSIVRSFLAAYPNGWIMLASNSLETPVLGLVGRADSRHFNVSELSTRLAHSPLPPRLAYIGIEDEFALLGSFVAGPASLQRFAANADLNTDDRPVVAYRAPRVTYEPDSLPRDRLASLLANLSIEPQELVAPDTDAAWTKRLSAYWTARNQFIAHGRNVHPSADVRRMLAQVREPLLSVLRTSPDFRPAYDPLVLMAGDLARTNLSEARSLLTELSRTQPARPEAGAALLALGSP